MTASDETFVNPDGARVGASQLTAATESLAGQWSRLAGIIETLNQGRPWGDDQAGQEFFKNYLKEGADGEQGPARLTLDGGGKLIERVRQFGPDVSSAVQGTVDMDDIVATWFGGDN